LSQTSCTTNLSEYKATIATGLATNYLTWKQHTMFRTPSTILLLMLLTSCISFKPFEFSIPFAATDTAPYFGKKVVVANRVDTAFLYKRNAKHIKVIQEGFNSFMATIVEDFCQSGAEAIAWPGVWNPIPKIDPMELSDPSTVATLAKDAGADFVLTINYYDVDLYQQRVESVRDIMGDKTRTAFYNIKMKTRSTLYNNIGVLLEKYPLSDDIPYADRFVMLGVLAVNPGFTGAGETISKLSAILAHKINDPYMIRMVPVSTMIFSGKPFRDAEIMMRKGQWDAAEKLLEDYLKTAETTRAQGQAAYNLAIVKIAKGHIELYNKYADIAMHKTGVMPMISEASVFNYK
jgi:Family of unknown function (DUF6340)